MTDRERWKVCQELGEAAGWTKASSFVMVHVRLIRPALPEQADLLQEIAAQLGQRGRMKADSIQKTMGCDAEAMEAMGVVSGD